ncbi:Integral membrane protein DUF6 [human gut metagenome]|uniref:Threonine and homoserine efflux system n=2 Tax=root TaxID=1 RepID=A0A6N3FAE4_9FIRM
MKKSYLKYLSSLLLFGSNGIVASYILLNSHEIVFLRTFIGSIFLLCLFLLSKQKLQAFVNKKDAIYLIASGISTGISWLFLYQAYTEIGVSLATLACYCGPIIVILLSPLIFNERLNIYKISGFIIVFTGMIFVNGSELSQTGISFGLVCGILSAVTYSLMVIFAKKVKTINGLEYSFIQLISSFLIVAIFLGLKQGFYIPKLTENIFPVLFLGVINTGIGCYLYFSSIKELPAGTVAICGYLEPLSALFFSAIFLNERLSFIQIIGAIFIIGGAIISELSKYLKEKKFESEIEDSTQLSSNE